MKIHNPATGAVVRKVPFCNAADIDTAVKAAAKFAIAGASVDLPIRMVVAGTKEVVQVTAEAPVIELETADNQFAAMYIGFASADLDQNQIDLLREVCRRVPVTVDSRFALLRFRGMTAVTPNEPEVEDALRTKLETGTAALHAAGTTRPALRRRGQAQGRDPGAAGDRDAQARRHPVAGRERGRPPAPRRRAPPPR